MSDTFTQLYYHIVFSTKDRQLLISKEKQEELYCYLGAIIKGEKGHLIAIGGMPDHIHLLASLSPSISLSEILKKTKGHSSKWMNRSTELFFKWQSGYGAFTVSRSKLQPVEEYILNQEEHHHKLSFQDEFRALLEKHDIAYDERYIWN